MTAADPAAALYERRAGLYEMMIRLIGHRRRLRRFMERADVLTPGLRVLDAGCGSGAMTMAVFDAAARLGIEPVRYRAFDLSPRMLATFASWRDSVRVDVEFRTADARAIPAGLPDDWRDFGLVVSAGMLEYLPKETLASVLERLRGLMADGATMLVFISKDSLSNRLFIGGFWKANVYRRDELETAFAAAGLRILAVRPFGGWGYAVTARR